jgi:hypothetical protein
MSHGLDSGVDTVQVEAGEVTVLLVQAGQPQPVVQVDVDERTVARLAVGEAVEVDGG